MKITDLKAYSVVGSGNALLPKTIEKKKTTGQKILDAGESVANFIGAKGISEQFGADIARLKSKPDAKNLVSYPRQKEVLGSALQTGALFLPGAGSGAGLATKALIGAGTGYALDVGSKLQNKDTSVGEALKPGVGTGVGATLPVVGALVVKPATAIVSRLLKGIGSGLSGVPTKTIEAIVENPKAAEKASEKLAQSGNSKVLEENAKKIVNGISTVRQEARKAFGEGLEQLSETDITPKVFRDNVESALDKFGVTKQDGVRAFSNAEFSDPKNIKKATELVDRLSSVELDGKSLRKLADDIENAAYKVATGDERLSFNAFVKNLSSALKSAISASTDKLDDLNRAFSQDMQLVEATESILGKVNFKNLNEVVKASQKLEGLFSQKGLAPDVVDSFLQRIGTDSGEFKAGEAVRQMSNKVSGANAKGLSVGELMQQITSSVITPQAVKEISIRTGLAREALAPFLQALKKMKPTMQSILIDALLQEGGDGR